MRTFVPLFWQVTTLEAHTLSLFHGVCVLHIGGAAQSWWVQKIYFVLLYILTHLCPQLCYLGLFKHRILNFQSSIWYL